MTTLFLRFPSEGAFLALMPPDFQQEGETGSPLPDGVTALSIIGPHMKTDGSTDPRWHINALGVLPDAWGPYQIFPETPERVFG